MKKMYSTPVMMVLLALSSFSILTSSCTKAKKCEDNNTYTLVVVNNLPKATINFNIDKDFVSVNGGGDYSVKAGETTRVSVQAGSHTVYARSIITNCVGNRCSVSVAGKAPQTINQQACSEATLAY